MSDGIFLVQNDGQLVEMTEQPYDSEDVLQGLLAKYPNLLAGGQFEGFLNEQMDPAEVLAVEIKQYCGGQGMRTLVPRVFGQTAEAERKKVSSRSDGVPWDEERFFETLRANRGTDDAAIARELFDWGKAKASSIRWGIGKTQGSVFPLFAVGNADQRIFGLWTTGLVEIPFGWMESRIPFDNLQLRTELAQKISIALGNTRFIDPNSPKGWPKFPLAALTDTSVRSEFCKALEWAYQQICQLR